MIKGFYDRYMYSPMPEMHNEMIPVTDGCSYGKCLFCDLNVGKSFKVFNLEDIKEYIRKRAKFYEDKRFVPSKFTLLEGNALCLKTDSLVEILKEIRKNFPKMKYVSTFARADDVLRKSKKDLKLLKSLGLDRVCVGIESGDERVLSYQQKGVTVEDQYNALKLLEELGISYSVYIMLGLGGKKYSKEHILNTARFLNRVNPFEIVVVNLVIFSGAGLVERIRTGEFERITLRQQIEEEIMLLENLDIRTIYNGTHKTKVVPITTLIPDRKEDLVKILKENLKKTDKELLEEERKKWKIWDKE
ncbi:radical SAM protein [Lagierella sp.]|uniref:radical SAM protein n=1 Tax=Lagierella sp. TaxID=2849657 RepID=UPI0026304FF8|nr:radical SAM protein [Lagierella sp.]